MPQEEGDLQRQREEEKMISWFEKRSYPLRLTVTMCLLCAYYMPDIVLRTSHLLTQLFNPHNKSMTQR